MTKLDEIALNAELVLISIVEAVALTFLAEAASHLIHGSNWVRHLPYMLAGLVIILLFWAQAILHALSFIRWPVRIEHTLLYFVAAFVQVLAYSEIEDLPLWFLFWLVFSGIGLVIYLVDLRIIRACRFPADTDGAYKHALEARQLYELKILVPAAIVFNAAGAGVTFAYPAWFENTAGYLSLGILQLLFSTTALVDCMRNFAARSAIIPSVMSHA